MLTKGYDEKYEDWEKFIDTDDCNMLNLIDRCFGCVYAAVCNDFTFTLNLEKNK